MTAQPPPRKRRETCFWEPTYAPELVGVMKSGEWDFEHNRGPTKSFFDGASFDAFILNGGRRIFRNVTFTDCDFQGFFVSEAQIVFNGCSFINCDFGLTTWKNVKFSGCTFSRSSFGQTRFDNCEFRSCSWNCIGLSPNGTELNSTYFSNSSAVIAAAYTTTDANILVKHNANVSEQKVRLEQTKATVARRILKMLQIEGDERSFYDAVKTFQLQHARAERADAMYKVSNNQETILARFNSALRLIQWTLEGALLSILGYINAWGSSIVRPIMISMASLFIFFMLYRFALSPSEAAPALQRSFDIATLAGYTNYGREANRFTVGVQNIQLFTSILLYSITFATIVNRLSRVR